MDGLQNVDMSLDIKDRAETLPILDGDDLGDLSIPDGISADVQVPIGIPYESSHPIGQQTQIFVESNQVCIESDTTKWARRDVLAGGDCFASGDCDRLDTVSEVRKENILAKVWYDQYKSYRRVFLDSGEEVFIGRAWIEEQFLADGEKNSWDQLFQLDVYVENGKTTDRYFAMWSSVTLAGIGDDAYANLVVDGIAQSATFSDEFIDGNIETCKNDRGAEKPDR
jgi:hypothetical protein